jgi:hypothetical protein
MTLLLQGSVWDGINVCQYADVDSWSKRESIPPSVGKSSDLRESSLTTASNMIVPASFWSVSYAYTRGSNGRKVPPAACRAGTHLRASCRPPSLSFHHPTRPAAARTIERSCAQENARSGLADSAAPEIQPIVCYGSAEHSTPIQSLCGPLHHANSAKRPLYHIISLSNCKSGAKIIVPKILGVFGRLPSLGVE